MCTKGYLLIFVRFPETFHSAFLPVRKVQCSFSSFHKKIRLSFREVYENFPWWLLACGSRNFLRNSLFSSHLAKLEGSLLVSPSGKWRMVHVPVDGEAGVGEDLLGRVDVGALEADHQGDLQVDGPWKWGERKKRMRIKCKFRGSSRESFSVRIDSERGKCICHFSRGTCWWHFCARSENGLKIKQSESSHFEQKRNMPFTCSGNSQNFKHTMQLTFSYRFQTVFRASISAKMVWKRSECFRLF